MARRFLQAAREMGTWSVTGDETTYGWSDFPRYEERSPYFGYSDEYLYDMSPLGTSLRESYSEPMVDDYWTSYSMNPFNSSSWYSLPSTLKEDIYDMHAAVSQTYSAFKMKCRPHFLALGFLFCHALLLHSGFVGLDQVSWSSTASMISTRYTLPAIVANGSGVKENVHLKFQSLGNFAVVYGCVSDGRSQVHRVCLDENICALASRLMVSKSESKGNGPAFPEMQVFELWKMVKDGLALPLLIDLCEKVGLDPPPCFMRLPLDAKRHILKYLPAVDIAKMACLSKELNKLSLDNELWRNKFREEIANSRENCLICLPIELKLMMAEYLPPTVNVTRLGCLCSEFKHFFDSENAEWKQRIKEDNAEGSSRKRLKCFKNFFALHWARNKSIPALPFAYRVFGHFLDRGVYDPFRTPSIVDGMFVRLPHFDAFSTSRHISSRMKRSLEDQRTGSYFLCPDENLYTCPLSIGVRNSLPWALKEDISVMCATVSQTYNVFKMECFLSPLALDFIFFHALLLHSGFVGLDQALWSSTASTISAKYTLPAIVANGSGIKGNVHLKFRSLGNFAVVYGCVSDGRSQVHRICLDENISAPALRLMLSKSELQGNGPDFPEMQVYELWKMVKDGLALPLLIDLCENVGLDPPPCFMRLPPGAKRHILKYLPAVDVAKMACLSKELNNLSLDNQLWRNKFEDEFAAENREHCLIHLPLGDKLMMAEYLPPTVNITRLGCLCSVFEHFSSNNYFWDLRIKEDEAEGSSGKRGKCFKNFFALHWKRNRSIPATPIASHAFRQDLDRGEYHPFRTPSIVDGVFDGLPGFDAPSTSKRL